MNTVGPDHEQEQHQQPRGDRVGVGEVLDALLDAGHRRDHEAERQDRDHRDGQGLAAAADAEDVVDLRSKKK